MDNMTRDRREFSKTPRMATAKTVKRCGLKVRSAGAERSLFRKESIPMLKGHHGRAARETSIMENASHQSPALRVAVGLLIGTALVRHLCARTS